MLKSILFTYVWHCPCNTYIKSLLESDFNPMSVLTMILTLYTNFK